MLRSLCVLIALTVAASGQQPRRFSDIASIETQVSAASVKPGQIVTVSVTVSPKPGWHTYPQFPNTMQTSKTRIALAAESDLVLFGTPADPLGAMLKTDSLGAPVEEYDDAVTFELRAIVRPSATPGKKTIRFDGSLVIVCDENAACFPAKASDFPEIAIEVQPGPSLAVPPEYKAAVDLALGPKSPPGPVTPLGPTEPKKEKESQGLIRKDAKPTADYKADLDAISASLVKDPGVTATVVGSGLWGLLTAAVFWGFVSLVTPCVFPMIPITVSLFLKQSHQSTGGAVKFAFVYCLTIVVVLGLAAVFLLSMFRELSVSPGMNLFLGLLLVYFALSLFGMYDIQLPGFLLRATERRRAAGGLIGTVFGALAFSIVSFTCVAPFLGGFAGLAATGNYSRFELILAGLTFAAAFASPFFVLALFPSLLKKLPKSGGWLDTVKAVMGFLELAAALKFFRAVEIRLPPVEYFTFDVVLSGWIAISVACGLYLLGFFRLPHDDEKTHLGVPRLVFALLFLGLGVYLAPGLFKAGDGKVQRPAGMVFAWVEAFLLPDANNEMPWSFDLKAALEEARQERSRTGKPAYVFTDFTGVNCSNCRFNENSVFPIPTVNAAMLKYRLVQMYTDDMPLEAYQLPPSSADRKAEADANLAFQEKLSGTTQLPLYVIFEPLPDGKTRVVGIYDEGKINDKRAFEQFVSKPVGK